MGSASTGAGGEGYRHLQTPSSKGRPSGGLCQEWTEHRTEQDWLAGKQGEGPGGSAKEGLTCRHHPDSQGREGYCKQGDKQEQRHEWKHVGLSQSSPCSCCLGSVEEEWSWDEGLGLQGMARRLARPISKAEGLRFSPQAARRPRRAGSEQNRVPLRLREREGFLRPGVPE